MAAAPQPDPVFFGSIDELGDWLVAHHDEADELHVGFWKRHTGRPGPTQSQAVDEALRVGWIDGVVRSLGAEAYAVRFTPRRPGSIWSKVNIDKYAALLAAGRVLPAGAAAYAARRADRSGVYSYERPEPASLTEAEEAEFGADPVAWAYFQAAAPSYRRTALHWVTSAKRPQTRARRLATLIADSAAGRKLRHLDPSQLPSARAKAASKGPTGRRKTPPPS